MNDTQKSAQAILRYFKHDEDITEDIFRVLDIRRTYLLLGFEYNGINYKASFYNDLAYSNNKNDDYIGKISLTGPNAGCTIKIYKDTPERHYYIKEILTQL